MRVSQEELHDVLDYNPETGVFTWKHSSPSTKKGEVAGKIYDNGYRYIAVAGVYFPAALLAWIWVHGVDPKGVVDHIDLDKLNDRISNLRPATRSQNRANRNPPAHNRSGFKGVFWNSQKMKWHARIMLDYKSRHLGFFDSIEDAARAYKEAALQTWGEFARVPSEEEIQQIAKGFVKESEKSAEDLGL